MFLDLDDFKHVNDTRGHTVGDRLLVVVTERLRATLRPGDTAARLGGDEFAILMEDTDLAAAEAVAERILQTLSDPVDIDGDSWSVRASIGISVAEPATATGEELLRDADVAMYWAKEQGKGRVSVFDAERRATALERISLRTDLVRALEAEEFVLHYQPTVDLGTRAITGFEALVRWDHPRRGLLPPKEFIAAAEASGHIVPLGSWVLREACTAALGLQREGSSVTMAVNVSAQQLLCPGFVEEVASVLADTGLDAGLLVLEITESVLLDDVESAAQALHGLRGLGASIAIDDFGTGYSSLSYLSQLPVDILKVDKSFVDGITLDGHAASLTLAILEMSRTLHMVTVAEGVETAEQAAWLEDAGVRAGPGLPLVAAGAARRGTRARRGGPARRRGRSPLPDGPSSAGVDADERRVAPAVDPHRRDGRAVAHRVLEGEGLVLREEPALDPALEPPARVVAAQEHPLVRAAAQRRPTDPDVSLPRQRDPRVAARLLGGRDLGVGQLAVEHRLAGEVGVAQVDVRAAERVHRVDGRHAQPDLLAGEPRRQRGPDGDDDEEQLHDDDAEDEGAPTGGAVGGRGPGLRLGGGDATDPVTVGVLMTGPPSPRARAVVGHGRRGRRWRGGRRRRRGRGSPPRGSGRRPRRPGS